MHPSYADILQKREENGIRLNKFIADCGHCSRRQADFLIENGLVEINGEKATMGTRVKVGMQVKVEEKIYTVKEADPQKNSAQIEKIYLAFHKPKGIICTTDLSVKGNIIEALQYPTRIFPIGRLDKDSTGLILLTNDGDIVNRLLRSENKHEKEYEVEVKTSISDETLNKMQQGLYLHELEQTTLPCKIKRLSKTKFRIVLVQGLNRQIRRMCEAVGAEVKTLERIRILNISLGNLKKGEYRKLGFKELAQLESLL